MYEIIKKAVELLNSKFNLPSEGFITGGALANTINKLKWGGKCVINDIDIFILDEIKPFDNNQPNHTFYETRTSVVKHTTYEKCDYDNLNIIKKFVGGDYVTIKTSDREDIFNYVKFDSNKRDYNLLLETFDINCTQVGWDLEREEAYWTKDFEDFFNTKELKVSLPNTPSHTALRLLKKRDELDARLDIKNEFDFLTFVNLEKVIGLKRYWFGQKYFDLYKKYESEINPYFSIINRIKNINPSDKNSETYSCWRLYPNEWYFSMDKRLSQHSYSHEWNSSMPPNHIGSYIKDEMTIEEYKYYWKNIRPDLTKKLIWRELQKFYKHNDYLNGVNLSNIVKYQKDISELSKWIDKYQCLIKSFYGVPLLKQIILKNWLFEICEKNQDLYHILNYHAKSLNYNTKQELEDEMSILKIYYRKKIHQHKNTDKVFY